MKTETKILGLIFGLTAILVAGAVFFLSKPQDSSKVLGLQTQVQIDYDKGQKVGSDSAKVRVAEFSDLQCPACKATSGIVKKLIGDHKDGSFQFVYMHFPLSQHKNANLAANAAEDAGEQGKFWEMHDKLFETQNDWADLGDPADFFAKLAQDIGIDGQKVKEAVKSNKYSEKINQNVTEGNKAKVNATPTFFINGKKVVVTSPDTLEQEVSKLSY